MPIKTRCDQCRLALTGKKAGNKHAQETGHVWKPGYYCTVCGATWSKRSESKGHIARYHPNQGAPLTSLPVVTETSHVTSPSSARAQTQTSSPLRSSSTRPFGTVEVACYKCGERFGDTYALQTHRQIGCAGVPLARDAHQDETAHDDHQPDKMCQICGTAFPDKNALDEHLSGNFTCKKCAVHHASEEELQEHYQHESKLHPHCKTCELAFENMATWAQHKARCPPAQPAAKEPSVSECEDTTRAVSPIYQGDIPSLRTSFPRMCSGRLEAPKWS
ncbi:hypothetical protein K466DRAFT_76717 [Polyporus arcularius HHB13444]|uniref:C2H2-type domain-containing protein n=1 Tax=Polyporus arcularius HHB13444 TaxID=1314778 RepID=A0A5C3PGE9_9APHY|nr:hypothetical protein K466DRAFT_76717 [Polyporus arcularius HHB13444]